MAELSGIMLRRADITDLPAIAVLFRRTRETSLAFLPQLHTREEDIEFFRSKIFAEYELTAAEIDGRLAGYSAVAPGWLEQLYVLPQLQGRGIGGQLLLRAMESQTDFQFFVFQKNHKARRFYERHGARLVRLTDGAENEEREPDALYEWRAADAQTDSVQPI